MEKVLKLFDLETDQQLNSIMPTPSGHFYSPFLWTWSLRRSNQLFSIYKVRLDKHTNSVNLETKEEWDAVLGAHNP